MKTTRKKERKKTEHPRKGWEDGTPPPHRDFKKRGVVEHDTHEKEPLGARVMTAQDKRVAKGSARKAPASQTRYH